MHLQCTLLFKPHRISQQLCHETRASGIISVSFYGRGNQVFFLKPSLKCNKDRMSAYCKDIKTWVDANIALQAHTPLPFVSQLILQHLHLMFSQLRCRTCRGGNRPSTYLSTSRWTWSPEITITWSCNRASLPFTVLIKGWLKDRLQWTEEQLHSGHGPRTAAPEVRFCFVISEQRDTGNRGKPTRRQHLGPPSSCRRALHLQA